MRRATGVRVARHRANAEVAVEDPLAAKREDRASFAVERAALLERAVAIGETRLEREKLREVRAPRLLLAFDQEPDPDGKIAEHGAVRLDRLDAQKKVSFVVVDAARVHGAVPDRGLVW